MTLDMTVKLVYKRIYTGDVEIHLPLVLSSTSKASAHQWNAPLLLPVWYCKLANSFIA